MKYFFGILVACFLTVGAVGHLNALAADSSVGDDDDDSSVGTSDTLIIDNPIKADTIQQLFLAIIDIVLVFAVPIIVFFIILAGFKYVTAQGNSEAISEANRMLLYALIGGMLILGAHVLIQVIQGTIDSIKKP